MPIVDTVTINPKFKGLKRDVISAAVAASKPTYDPVTKYACRRSHAFFGRRLTTATMPSMRKNRLASAEA